MRRGRPLLLAGTLCAATLLSGCVAAAIPALAAGGVFESRRHAKEDKAASAAQPGVAIADPQAAGTAAPQPGTLVRGHTLADGTRMEVMAGPPDPSPATETAPAALTPVAATSAPAPGNAAGYAALLDFAQTEGAIPPSGNERHSAILAHALDLKPETTECSIHPAAVLIDLDPAGGTLDPAAAVHADPAFAAGLQSLREQGVAIAWISANSADRAGDIRRTLVASGLDPEGRDELALLRYPDERKQTRREDFAKEFCLVAIAGDDRGDFDELYQYNKDRDAAAPLDALIGNGWFLIPQPLT
jgi:hypothetical protein